MGPICDNVGVEQGGINSGDFYKLYNNSQLEDAQKSGLGVQIGSSKLSNTMKLSAVGQADDVVLCSNNIYSLQCLLRLTTSY